MTKRIRYDKKSIFSLGDINPQYNPCNFDLRLDDKKTIVYSIQIGCPSYYLGQSASVSVVVKGYKEKQNLLSRIFRGEKMRIIPELDQEKVKTKLKSEVKGDIRNLSFWN